MDTDLAPPAGAAFETNCARVRAFLDQALPFGVTAETGEWVEGPDGPVVLFTVGARLAVPVQLLEAAASNPDFERSVAPVLRAAVRRLMPTLIP